VNFTDLHAKGRGHAVIAAVGSLGLFTVLSFAGVSMSQATTTVTVASTADSYVDSSAPTTSFGGSIQLRIDGSPTLYGFIHFDLTAVTGTVGHATLRLHANSAPTMGYDVSATGGGWTESSLTWATAPAVSPALVGSMGAFAAGTTTDVDVTSAVKSGGSVDFAIADRNATAISFGSRESANPPELILTIGSGSSSTAAQRSGGPSASASPKATPRPTPALTAPAPSPSASATARSTASAPAAGDPVLVGAGDICVTTVIQYASSTAKLIEARPADQVFTLGDNSNDTGTPANYSNCYARTWGPFLSRTRATIGNHDCMTANCAPYYAYFGATAGPANKGYYSYNLANSWHVVVLNSQCSEVGGCSKGSPQETWLRADLAANTGKHILAMWHIPAFSSGGVHGNNANYLVWWQDLYAAHADLILDGHDHNYERFALQSPSAIADPNGIREFVVGTGGAGQRPMGTIRANSQVRNSGTYGVLVLTLHAHGYSWQFVPVAGATFTDSGTQATHS
jgi:hypothetical protein